MKTQKEIDKMTDYIDSQIKKLMEDSEIENRQKKDIAMGITVSTFLLCTENYIEALGLWEFAKDKYKKILETAVAKDDYKKSNPN